MRRRLSAPSFFDRGRNGRVPAPQCGFSPCFRFPRALTPPGSLHFPHPPCSRPIHLPLVQFLLISSSCRCEGAAHPPKRCHLATPAMNNRLRPEVRVGSTPAWALNVRTALHLDIYIRGDATAVAELRARKYIPPGAVSWLCPALDRGAHTRLGGKREGRGGGTRFKNGSARATSLVAGREQSRTIGHTLWSRAKAH